MFLIVIEASSQIFGRITRLLLDKQLIMCSKSEICIQWLSSWSTYLGVFIGFTGSLCTSTMLAINNWMPFLALILGLFFWGSFFQSLNEGELHTKENLFSLALILNLISFAYSLLAQTVPPL
jgi:hypothetical protein